MLFKILGLMSFKRLGDYIKWLDNRNTDLERSISWGITLQKIFMPSVANVSGTDYKNIKIN